MSAKIHTLNTSRGSEIPPLTMAPDQFDALITKAVDSLKFELHRRFSEMLNGADQNLSNFPELTASDETKEQYRELVHILHSERNKIDSAFFNAINEKNNRCSPAQNLELTELDGLSLVEQEDMDEMVAVTAMYSKAMNKYQDEVNNLQARIQYLERKLNKTAPKNTFNPKHICEAFRTALSGVDIPVDYKLLLFKLFDQDVSSRLGDMYQSLNQLFISAGVMPEVVYTVEKPESGSELTESTRATTTNDSNPEPSDGEHLQNLDSPGPRNLDSPGPRNPGVISFENHRPVSSQEFSPIVPRNDIPGNRFLDSRDDISHFISQFITGTGTARGKGIPESFSIIPSDTGSRPCYSRNDVMGALSNLQNNLANDDIKTVQAIDTGAIKRAVLADIGRSKGGAVSMNVHNYDQRRIDFVGMIFQAIATDENVSAHVAKLIKLLQIPVTKAVMLDGRLFAKKDHPVRNTLDLITRAGKGVTDTKDSMLVALRSIVHRLLKDYDVDNASFDKAAKALHTLIEQKEEESAESERLEQRAIIKQHARHVVLGEIRRITLNKVIPKKVRPLMLKHWPTLMFNYYLNHGIQSNEWLGSLKIFGNLMACLQPIRNESQWRALKDKHESLVASVRKELYKTHQDRSEVEAQISALNKRFWRMLDHHEHKFIKQPAVEASEDTSPAVSREDNQKIENADAAPGDYDYDANVARIREEVEIAEQKMSQLPSTLHPGVWFEVFNGEDKPVRRLKLSVVLTESAKLIFVDRLGKKVIEKDVDDFLRELDNEQSRFIADHSTFETALGKVIHKLAA